MKKKLHLGDFTSQASNSKNIPKYYGETLVELGHKMSKIIVLTADLSPATECDLFQKRFPERFFTAGIAEANMIGISSGLSRMGFMPFVNTFSVFMSRRALDQIAMQIAYPNLNVKVCGFLPGLTTLLGVSHQAIEDNAVMRALPNLTIVEPCGARQIAAATRAVAQHHGPVYFRLHRPTKPLNVTESMLSLEIGKGQLLIEGSDAIIFAAGHMVDEALTAANNLRSKGINISVANIHTLKPLDNDFILQYAESSSAIITAENHSIIGGLGSAVAEVLSEAGISKPFKRIGVRDVFAEGGTTDYLFAKYEINFESIERAVIEFIN